MPNVGGDGWGEAQYGHPWQWPTGNSATVDGYVLAEYAAKTQGAKTASIFYFDSPQGRSYVKGFTKQFEKNGGKVVFSQPGTFDDPATATYIARSRTENVDMSTFWGEPGLWVKMIREAASQAYRPKFGFQGCACNYFDEIPGLAGPWAEGSIATHGLDAQRRRRGGRRQDARLRRVQDRSPRSTSPRSTTPTGRRSASPAPACSATR